ncbi:MAG: Uma2 family endonuclease [Chloroflexi bacterium]|nr:Uma2 family endonuclease [Chloroflexota bacterium]
MSERAVVPVPVEYPERDGKPMAETDVHREVMFDLIQTLTDYYRDQPDVYVSGNLLLYYEEGNPTASVAPDVFVVKGVGKGRRRIYRLWVEGKPPDVVIEVTSRGTRFDDLGTKRALYQELGVREYFQYDPLAEYLVPPQQGYRLVDGEYQKIEPSDTGALASEVLGLELRLGESGELRLVDPATGERLLTPAELPEARRVETHARRAAEARATELEADLARLRAELTARSAEGPDAASNNAE